MPEHIHQKIINSFRFDGNPRYKDILPIIENPGFGKDIDINDWNYWLPTEIEFIWNYLGWDAKVIAYCFCRKTAENFEG